MIFRATPIYEAETPLRKVCNVFRMNFLSRLLRDIKGVGCRIEKVWTLGGLGWRVVVDGNSDEPFPDGVTPPWTTPRWDTIQDAQADVTVKPAPGYDDRDLAIGYVDGADTEDNQMFDNVAVKAKTHVYIGVTQNPLDDLAADLQIDGGALHLNASATSTYGFGLLSTDAPGLIYVENDDLTLKVYNGYIRIDGLPTSNPGSANALYTQTASELGGTGSAKVICIS